MIHQIMHSGNIRTGNSVVVNKAYIQRILDHTNQYGYTGLTLYYDGSFLTLYEGQLDCIEKSRQRYNDTSLYSNITTMFSRPIEKRSFSDYRLGLGRHDSLEDADKIPGCFSLTPKSLKTVIPDTLPEEFKILTYTFARVNKLIPG